MCIYTHLEGRLNSSVNMHVSYCSIQMLLSLLLSFCLLVHVWLLLAFITAAYHSAVNADSLNWVPSRYLTATSGSFLSRDNEINIDLQCCLEAGSKVQLCQIKRYIYLHLQFEIYVTGDVQLACVVLVQPSGWLPIGKLVA